MATFGNSSLYPLQAPIDTPFFYDPIQTLVSEKSRLHVTLNPSLNDT